MGIPFSATILLSAETVVGVHVGPACVRLGDDIITVVNVGQGYNLSMPTNYGQGRPTHPDAMQARCEAARALVGGGPAAVRPIRKFPRGDIHVQVLRPLPSEGTPVWHGVKNLRAAI